MITAHVVEVDVDPSGRSLPQALADRGLLVIHDGIKTGLFREPPGLLVRPRRAHHPAALELGDLGRHRSDRPGCGRDEHLVLGLQLGDVEDPAICGESSTAERVHVDRERQSLDGLELA